MRKNSIRTVDALLLVISISVLATFQVQVAWLTTIIVTLAALAAAISALLGHRAILEGTVRPKIRRGLSYEEWLLAYGAKFTVSIQQMVKSKWTALSILTLFVSLATYQTAAMFYWVAAAVMLVNIDTRSWRERLRPVIFFCLVPFIAMALYFAIFSLLVRQPESLASSPYSWAVTSNILERITWFMKHPLLDAVNLWNVFPSTLFVFSFVFIAAGGLLCEILSSGRYAHNASERRSLLFSCLQKFGFLVLLIPLSILPNLAAEGISSAYRSGEISSSYRSLVALSPLIVIMLYWGLREIFYFILPKGKEAAVSLCLMIAALMGGLIAHHNVANYYVYLQMAEINYVKSILEEADYGKYKKIHVLSPKNSVYGRYDEFGVLTTSFPQHVYKVIKVALTELDREELFGTIQISSSTRVVAGDLDSQTLLIDMSVLEKQLGY